MPISSCRCGLPSANASWELTPAQVVQLDCHNWYAAWAMGSVRVMGVLTRCLRPAACLHPQHLCKWVPGVPTS